MKTPNTNVSDVLHALDLRHSSSVCSCHAGLLVMLRSPFDLESLTCRL